MEQVEAEISEGDRRRHFGGDEISPGAEQVQRQKKGRMGTAWPLITSLAFLPCNLFD